ncbi:MAG: GntR family transcriptional regulator [Pseudomonadota bacterium]
MADGVAEPQDTGGAPASAIALAFLARTAIIIIDIDFLGRRRELSTHALQQPTVARDSLGGLKVDRAAEMLRDDVLFRRLPPGAQLTEQALAARLGCSQGTVREALLRLAEEGLVERRSYRGTVVTETTLAEAAALVRMRLAIEAEVARRLSHSGLGDASEAVDALLAGMDTAHDAGDLSRCSDLDRAFHVALCRAAGLPLLCPVLGRAALHMHRFTLGGVEVPRAFREEAGVGHEHRALLNTVLAAGPDGAARAMAEHVATLLHRWAPSLLAAVGEDAFDAAGGGPTRRGADA